MIQTSPKVFISYSWDSDEHKDRVLELSNRLRSEGVDCRIDQYEQFPSQTWFRWMETQIEWAEFVLLICTHKYNQRFSGQETVSGKGAAWEGAIISQTLYDSYSKNTKFIPVIYSSEDYNNIPTILRGFSNYFIGPEEEGYLKLYRLLTNQHETPITKLGRLLTLPPRERKQNFDKPSEVRADNTELSLEAEQEPKESYKLAITLQNRPVIAAFKDKLYIVFKTNDGLNELYVASSDDGKFDGKFSVPVPYPNIRIGGSSAMAVFKSKLYIAFRANDESNRLHVASSRDGEFLVPASGYPHIKMGGNPAMAVFKSKLYIAFRANDESNRLHVASSRDGEFPIPARCYSQIQMGGNPAMVLFSDKLYIAFRADDDSNRLCLVSSEDGTFSASTTSFKAIEMDSDPAMAVFNDKLYIAFKANDGSNRLCLKVKSRKSPNLNIL